MGFVMGRGLVAAVAGVAVVAGVTIAVGRRGCIATVGRRGCFASVVGEVVIATVVVASDWLVGVGTVSSLEVSLSASESIAKLFHNTYMYVNNLIKFRDFLENKAILGCHISLLTTR